MNLEQLVARVDKIVDDSTYFDSDEITSILNQGVLRISGGLKRSDSISSVLTVPLPDLFTITTVTTNATNNVQMPATYQRSLVFASNGAGQELPIYDSFQEFTQVWPRLNYVGSVNGLAVQGKTLYYQGIPTLFDDLTLHFYRYPVEMVDTEDVPDGIPVEFHESLLVNYACREIYTIKEDGIDGGNFNTKKYDDRFQKALMELDATIPSYGAPFRLTR